MALHFTDENFEMEVKKSTQPVVVDFYADWCGPCKMMAPIVEKLADEYQGKVKIGKLNVDEAPDTAGEFGIMSIPTLAFFRDGKLVEKIVGAVSRDEIVKKLETL